jgi:transcriptional regulator with XRE-family HTH domain
MNEQIQRMISGRIRWAREAADLTQEALCRLVGFKDRQILSNIESGRREVTAEELVLFSEALRRPVDFFTDAFILTGEAAFSWRAMEADPACSTTSRRKPDAGLRCIDILAPCRASRAIPSCRNSH